MSGETGGQREVPSRSSRASERALDRLLVLFEAAVAVQEATDEDAVLAAVASGLARIGVSAHIELLRPDHLGLEGQGTDPGPDRLVLECAVIQPNHLLKAVERRLGRSMVGIVLDPDEPPYDAVLQRGEVVRVPDMTGWLVRALPWIEDRAARLFARLPALGQGVCAPVTDGNVVLGALSVWGPSIGEADVPAIALLGRHAGCALALLRMRDRDRDRARLDAALLVSRTVAHDINNALAPITGGADLLRTVPAITSDPVASSYLHMVTTAAADVADKVRRLQGIVRLEQTDAPLGPGRPLLDLERSVE